MEHIDIYCERIDASFWSEPLNALTNLAFIIAAFALHRKAKSMLENSLAIKWLTCFIFTIGIGSALFHTFANRITMLMDVIPILLFLLSYIVIFIRQVWQYSNFYTAFTLAIFILMSYLTGFLPDNLQLNGTIGYMPALIFLSIFTASCYTLSQQAFRYLLTASLLLICSMTARTIDMDICSLWPIGTHFLWHILNGAVLYFACLGLIYTRQNRAMT